MFAKTHLSDLVVFHNNVRSLNKNFNSIGDIFQNCNVFPDVLAITETKLDWKVYAPIFLVIILSKVLSQTQKQGV